MSTRSIPAVSIPANPFTAPLLAWYERHRRPLPWRESQDPYAIWLSEIILQQTRVAQGLPYWERFLAAYPTLQTLAAAEDDAVMRLWQGLGYYSRARNLLACARQVAALPSGWPRTAEALARLPGIGPYTAAAIASFAFGEVVPVLDGNVARVLARWYDLDADIALPATQQAMRRLAATLIDPTRPADFNQAMMEFGAMQCTPGQPPCVVCPVQVHCQALANGTVGARPVKAAAKARRVRYLHYLYIYDVDDRLLAHRREQRDIWQHLYQPLLLETDSSVMPDFSQATPAAIEAATPPSLSPKILTLDNAPSRHLLSHQELLIRRYQLQLPGTPPATPPYRWLTPAEWEQAAKPRPLLG